MSKKKPFLTILGKGESVDVCCTDDLKALRKAQKSKKKTFTIEDYKEILFKQRVKRLIYR